MTPDRAIHLTDLLSFLTSLHQWLYKRAAHPMTTNVLLCTVYTHLYTRGLQIQAAVATKPDISES
jgi:hypothetical protein